MPDTIVSNKVLNIAGKKIRTVFLGIGSGLRMR